MNENYYWMLASSDGTISEKELKRLIKDMFMMIKEENPEEVKLLLLKRWKMKCILAYISYFVVPNSIFRNQLHTFKIVTCVHPETTLQVGRLYEIVLFR